MKLKVIDIEGKEKNQVSLNAALPSEKEVNLHEIYLLKKYQDAYVRQGTHAVKNRSAVSGGGAKPYKQKGTGKARRGTNRTPLRVGGAVVFGPQPRSYKIKLNNKTIHSAFRSSFLIQKDNLAVLEVESGQLIKTKAVSQLINQMAAGKNKKVLVILEPDQINLFNACQNIENCYLSEPTFTPVGLFLDADFVFVTKEALGTMEEKVLK